MTGWPSLDYEATTYEGLQAEIGDDFLGETGDLIREHARAVLVLRAIKDRMDRNCAGHLRVPAEVRVCPYCTLRALVEAT